jgi:hypothetical protein
VGNLGVFEAMANAGKISAEAEANKGFELEKSIDRAIFRAKERFGAYLANSLSKSDFDERWSEVKPQVIRVIAEVATPTPGVIRRVGAALRPSLPDATKKVRPSSAKAAKTAAVEPEWIPDPAERTAFQNNMKVALAADLQAQAGVEKTAWAYDQSTKLYTSKDPMQRFACPGCGTEQEHLGFVRCAGGGCNRTWNSWPVRQQSSAKTGALTYVLMAREIKMRGDQFKLAAAGNVKIPTAVEEIVKTADMPQEPMPGMAPPTPGTMPGDNSGGMGAPMPSEQPATPGGDPNGGDLAGGVTEDSPIDQIQDALQDAIVALKDVQMLSINPALGTTASAKGQKITTLRTAMDRFWGLHKQMNYVAGMLSKEASEAIRTVDPRITSEALFVQGFNAAAKNEPLPPAEKTSREYLEGYVAFHKQGQSTPVDGDYEAARGVDQSNLTESVDQDQSNGARNSGSFLGDVGLDDAKNNQTDAGPFDTSQPAQREFASQMDADNAAGGRDRGQGESSSIQPTGSRRVPTKRGK